MTGRRLALLIATSSYDDPAFGRLRAPGADIEALRNVLSDPAIGGYDVEVLTNAASHEVNQAIDEFFAEAKLDDLVLLYFSGHGFKSDAGRLYLITRESRQRRLDSTAVSAQFVREQLDRCRSTRKVVILDCCYAGAFPPGATKGADHVDVLGGLSGRGCAVITASSALEYAFEKDGNSSQVSEAQPSVFTRALTDGLATGEADINGDGLIDIDELYDHVYKRVKALVPQQTPGRDSQLEGTLYVATSPRGPQPTPLPLEFKRAINSPLTSTRLGVVGELLKFSDGAHPGTLMAVRSALIELAKDDSIRVSTAAKSALESISGGIAVDADEAVVPPGVAVEAARSEAAEIVAEARREADEIRAQARAVLEESKVKAAQVEAELENQLAAQRQAAERAAAAMKVAEEADKRASLAVKRAANASAEAERTKRDAEAQARELVANARKVAEEILAGAGAALEQGRAEEAQAETPEAVPAAPLEIPPEDRYRSVTIGSREWWSKLGLDPPTMPTDKKVD